MTDGGGRANLTDRLAALAEKGARATERRFAQKSSFHAPPRVPFWIGRSAVVSSASQLLHGEDLTARLCSHLAPRLELAEAQDCLWRQEEDEREHGRLYALYLGKLNARKPSERAARLPIMDLIERALLTWRGAPQAQVLGINLLLEGEALALQQSAGNWLPCPLFRSINREIARDEARHIAFGRLYLTASLAELPLKERLAIHDWARDTWWQAIEHVYQDRSLAKRPLALGLKPWARQRWRHWQQEFRTAGLYGDEEAALFERR